MYHDFILVQSINMHGELKVHFAQKQYINWSYEDRIGATKKTNTPMFPIILSDESILIQEQNIGIETNCFKTTKNVIKFSDDYSIPGGFLICITGPEGYIPSLVKFKENPSISSRNFNKNINGYFEMKMNYTTKQASILLHILERAYFGLTVDFESAPSTFNYLKYRNLNDPFDITFSLFGGEIKNVEYSQIKNIYPELKHEDLNELTEILNELAFYFKENNVQHDEERNKLKHRISKFVLNTISLTSSSVTLIDASSENGLIAKLIESMFNYFR